MAAEPDAMSILRACAAQPRMVTSPGMSWVTTLLDDKPAHESDISIEMSRQLGGMFDGGELDDLMPGTRCVLRGLQMALLAQADRLREQEQQAAPRRRRWPFWRRT